MFLNRKFWRKLKDTIRELIREELSSPRVNPLTPEERKLSNFVYELGRYRFTYRSWLSKMGLPSTMVANDAEHTFGVTTFAVLIAAMKGLSEEKIFRVTFMSWLHDTPEVRLGDDDPNQRMYRGDKAFLDAMEMQALKDIFGNTPLLNLVVEVMEEYKAKKTLEAQIVKDADILDSVRELIELKAKGVNYYKKNGSRIATKRAAYFTEEARQLHDILVKGGPEVIWNHFLEDAPSTFTNGRYGK